mmetsp:Transcript_41683/g.102861  ORF Transcript_41683/g.102861 Transcript_41683/m.102861 type:complete len:265 (-) Transcript_41683:790-1584(-)
MAVPEQPRSHRLEHHGLRLSSRARAQHSPPQLEVVRLLLRGGFTSPKLRARRRDPERAHRTQRIERREHCADKVHRHRLRCSRRGTRYHRGRGCKRRRIEGAAERRGGGDATLGYRSLRLACRFLCRLRSALKAARRCCFRRSVGRRVDRLLAHRVDLRVDWCARHSFRLCADASERPRRAMQQLGKCRADRACFEVVLPSSLGQRECTHALCADNKLERCQDLARRPRGEGPSIVVLGTKPLQSTLGGGDGGKEAQLDKFVAQ